MNYWLMKTEADCYSIDDLKRDGSTPWNGVRNFQARNFMKEMRKEDVVFIYHSNQEPIGIVGMAKVSKIAHPDLTALDKKDEHYDPKSTKEKTIWECVDVKFKSKFKNVVTLKEIKNHPKLSKMIVAQKGSRLSVSPVSADHAKIIIDLGKKV